MPTKQSKRNLLKVLLVFLAFYLIFSAVYFKRIYQPWGTCDTDFTVFMRAAGQIAQKQDIYNTPFLETGIDFYKYSPAFALFMVPLSRLHLHLAVPLWYLSIFIFFMLAVFFTQRILAGGKEQVLSGTFYAFGILMTLRFLLSVVQRVQSDALVLVLIALFMFMLYRKKDIWAGFALASAVMVKLTPLIFLPYLVLKRRGKAVLASLGFIAGYLLAPALYLGYGRNLQYLKEWLGMPGKNPPEYFLWYKNQSLFSLLSRLLHKFFASGQIFILFVITAVILFMLIFLLPRRRQAQTGNPTGFSYLAEFSLVLILMVLFSPLAWKHTFVHLIIPHLVLLYYIFYLNPKDRAVKLLLIGSFFLNTVLNPELTGPFSQVIQNCSSITLGTLMLFAALLIQNADTNYHPNL